MVNRSGITTVDGNSHLFQRFASACQQVVEDEIGSQFSEEYTVADRAPNTAQ